MSSTPPETCQYFPKTQGVEVDRLHRAVGTFRNGRVVWGACKLLKEWWPETGSFFQRVLLFCKLQKTKRLKTLKLHLSRLGGTKLVQNRSRPLLMRLLVSAAGRFASCSVA